MRESPFFFGVFMKLRYSELARKLAAKSNHPQHKVGCVIVKRGRVIDFGWNQIKTHPASRAYGGYLHAELHALLGNSFEATSGATAYVVRVRRAGDLGISRPCPCCEAALRAAGIKIVYYSGDDGHLSEMRL